jgi:hypothetical protein
LALAAAGAAAVVFLLGEGAAPSARADVTAIGEEVVAQYEAGGDPLVMYRDGVYIIGTTLMGSTVIDPSLAFYPGADTFCVVLTTSDGTSYSYAAETGPVDGSCAPATTDPIDPSAMSALDPSLTSSPYWFGLSTGDCLLDDTSVVTNSGTASPGPLSSPTIVACTEPHVGEVYAIARIESQDAPDDLTFQLHSVELCEGTAFESYVGAPYFGSDLYYSVLYPTEASFSTGTNEMVCILATGDTTTGSLRDSMVESPSPSG